MLENFLHADFSGVKGQIVNVLGFVGLEVLVAPVHLGHCDTKAAMGSTQRGVAGLQQNFIYKNGGESDDSLQVLASPPP